MSKFFEIIQDIWKTLKRELIAPKIFHMDISINSKVREFEHLNCVVGDLSKIDFNVHFEEIKLLPKISIGSEFRASPIDASIKEIIVQTRFLTAVKELTMSITTPKLLIEKLNNIVSKVSSVSFNVKLHVKNTSSDYLLKTFNIKKHSISNFDRSKILNALIDESEEYKCCWCIQRSSLERNFKYGN